MLWLLLGLVVLILLAVWVTWTAMRLDRLDARVTGAWQSLDAQLVRRAVALRELDGEERARSVTDRALGTPDRGERAEIENEVGATIGALPQDRRDDRLRVACVQVQTARTFYNDAVRAYAALRSQRLPRLLRLGGRMPAPPYFDIDDSPGIR